MSASPERRFLGYATGLTLVVAVLAGLVAKLSLFDAFSFATHRYIAADLSGPAPLFAHQFLPGLYATIAVGYVLLPVGIASYYAVTGDRHPLFYAVLAAVAILSLPGLLFIGAVLFGNPANETRLRVLAAVIFVALGGAFWVALDRGPEVPDEPVPWIVFANLGVVVVFILGTILGPALAGGVASGFVETDSAMHPSVDFEVNYTPVDGDRNVGILTIRHAGGKAIPPGELSIGGDGFAAVEGVDQTDAGRWQGETSPGQNDDGPVVAPGDAVEVGMHADCEIHITYHYGESSTVIAAYDCVELSD